MKYEYSIVPASSGPIWVLTVLAVLMLGLVSLFAYLAWSSRHVSFEVSPEGLRIRGDLYGRSISAAVLRPDEARTLDLEHDTQFAPKWRTNGAGLPGYSAGWFKLRNGEKALLFVTDRSRIVYLPTSSGYSVLMSTKDPQAMVAAVKQVLPRATADR